MYQPFAPAARLGKFLMNVVNTLPAVFSKGLANC
jgi:hypothetical protein